MDIEHIEERRRGRVDPFRVSSIERSRGTPGMIILLEIATRSLEPVPHRNKNATIEKGYERASGSAVGALSLSRMNLLIKSGS